MRLRQLLLLVCLLLLAQACRKDEPQPASNEAEVELQFRAENAGTAYVLGQTLYYPSVVPIRLDVLMFLVHNPRLVKIDGTEVALKDYLLVDMDPQLDANSPGRDKSRVGTSFRIKVPTGNYQSIRFGLGADPSVSGEKTPSNYKPNSYPSGHPLAPGMGMDWDAWHTYRHIRLEGKLDTTAMRNGPPNVPFTYHTGFDSLYKSVELPVSFLLGGAGGKCVVALDLQQFFIPKLNLVPLPEERYTEMGSDEESKRGIKVTQNFIKALNARFE